MKFLIILLSSLLFADIKEDFLNKNYSKICRYSNIQKTHDEKILSLIGVSCVRSDKIVFLPFVIQKLRKTSIGRKNAIYFLTIVMQKRLLYSYLFDNQSLDGFFLPKTDYILSKIFYALKNRKYKKIGDKIEVDLKNSKIYFYKQGDKMIVDEYINGNLIRRWYR